MARELTTNVKIAGSVDGSLTSGINKLMSSMKSLRSAAKDSSATTKMAQSMKSQQKELLQLQKQYANSYLENGPNSAASQALATQIQDVSKALQENQSKFREAAQAAVQLAQGYNQTGSASGQLRSTISQQESALANLKQKYTDVALAQGKDSDEAKKLASEIQQLSSELQDNRSRLSDAEQAANEFDNSLEQSSQAAESAKSAFNSLKETLGSLVSAGIQKACSAMKDLTVSSFNIGKDFQAGMSEVKAISGASSVDMVKLTDIAKQMGETTSFSASDAADALKYMAMAGWQTDEMLTGIEPILSLAQASALDLGTTSDIVTDALTAFGMGAGDAGHFSDVLAMTSSKANTNVSMLGETFKNVAPLAGTLGYTVDDVSVGLGLMANSGIKGGSAGTQLRSALANLANPSKDVSTAMQALGLSLTDSTGEMKPFSQQLGEMRKAFAGLSKAEKSQYASIIAGKQGMSGFLAMMDASDAEVQKLTDSIQNCGGAAKEMATTMTDNLSGDLAALSSKMEAFKLQIFDVMEPLARLGTQTLTNSVVPALMETIRPMSDLMAYMKAIKTQTAEGGNLEDYLPKNVSTDIETLQRRFEMLQTIMNNCRQAWNNFKAGFESSGAIQAVKQAINDVYDSFLKVAGVMSGDAANGARSFGEALGTIVKWAAQAISWFANLNASTGGLAGKIALAGMAFSKFGGLFSGLLPIANGVWGKISAGLSSCFSKVGSQIQSLPLFQTLSSKFQSVFGSIKGHASSLLGTFKSIGSSVTSSLLSPIKKIPSLFSGIFKSIPTSFSGLASSITSFIPNLIGKVQSIPSTFSSMVASIGGHLTSLLGKIKSIPSLLSGMASSLGTNLMTIFGKVKSLPSMLLSSMKSLPSMLLGSLKSMGSSLSDFLLAPIKSIPSLFQNLVGTLKSGLTGVIGMVKNIPSLLASGLNAIGGFLVIGGIAAVIGAIIQLWNTSESFRSSVIGVWNSIKEAFSSFGDSLVQKLNELGFNFQSIGEVLRSVWDGFCGFMEPVLVGALQLISDFVSFALDAILGFVDIISGVFTGNWSQVWEGVKQVFSATWDFICNIFSNVSNTIIEIGSKILSWFGSDWDSFWEGIKNTFSNVWDGIKEFFSNAVESIRGIWEKFTGWFSDSLGKIGNFFGGIGDGIGKGVSWVGNALGGLWNGASNSASSAWSDITGAVDSGGQQTVASTQLTSEQIQQVLNGAWDEAGSQAAQKWTEINAQLQASMDESTNIITASQALIQTAAQEAYSGLAQGAQEGFTALKEMVVSLMSETVQEFQTKVQELPQPLMDVLNQINEMVSSGLESFSTAFSTSMTTVSTTVQTATSIISSAFSTLSPVLAGVGVNADEAASHFTSFGTVLTNFSAQAQLIPTAISLVTTALATIPPATTSAGQAMTRLATTANTAFQKILSVVRSCMSQAASAVASASSSMASTFASAMRSMLASTSILNSIASRISAAMSAAVASVQAGVAQMQAALNVTLQGPNIKLPHISVSGSFSINPPSAPSFSVSWYKEGGILNGAQIFGQAGGSLLGGGEAGKEAVLPLSELWKQMERILTSAIESVASPSPLFEAGQLAGNENFSLSELASGSSSFSVSYAPSITINGATGSKDSLEQDIMALLQKHEVEFADFLSDLLERKQDQIYG